MTDPARPLVVVFDLDDTLYPEITYVESGLRAVAARMAERWPVGEDDAFRRLWRVLEAHGRGKVFDLVLDELGMGSTAAVRDLLSTYRRHTPRIALPEESRRVLDALAPRPLYLVTDGHKGVQARKIAALGLAPRFRRCFVTRRYGLVHEKPSPHVFHRILALEGCAPERVVYVGDDPAKDFRGIRPLGFRTLRVLQGRHAGVRVPPERDAECAVARLSEVPGVIAAWEAAA